MTAAKGRTMRVAYYKDPEGNFGDDLNELIWPRLFPDLLERDDDDLLLGIGTIFSQLYLPPSKVAGKRVFVLGSGVGYAPLPADWPDASWHVLALRGPLSDRVTGLSASVSDGALLLAALPDLAPEFDGPKKPIFVPHRGSMPGSRWGAVAAAAGIELVDPRDRPDVILKAFQRASLVVCEAMHAAIVADTLRIPWVPLVISPQVLPFKWFDWCWSLNLPYRPTRITPSSTWEALRHHKLRRNNRDLFFDLPQDANRAIVSDILLDDFWKRYSDPDMAAHAGTQHSAHKNAVRKALGAFDAIFIERAARHLERAARSTSYLSEDRVFAERLGQLQSAAETLRKLAH